MSNIWIVVADSYRARIFSADKPAAALTELETLANPAARQHEGEIDSDRAGHVVSGGFGGHDLSQKTEAKQEEATRFAADVCQHLEKGRNGKAFGKLYIIAAPAFLGLLRKQISTPLKALVSDEIAKDLTTQTPDRIRAQLPEYL
jgi:protein required for attachment to host cells